MLCDLCFSWKAALKHTTDTTADVQLAHTFCTSVRGNTSLYQQMAVVCNRNSRRESRKTQYCGHTNHCYDEGMFAPPPNTATSNQECVWQTLNKWVKLWKLQRQDEVPFFFLFPPCTVISLAEQPIKVIFLMTSSAAYSTCSLEQKPDKGWPVPILRDQRKN